MALADIKSTHSIKPVKGAVASSNPSIPNDVTHAAPNWCFLTARAGILIPTLFDRKLATLIIALTKNAGKKSASLVLCLC